MQTLNRLNLKARGWKVLCNPIGDYLVSSWRRHNAADTHNRPAVLPGYCGCSLFERAAMRSSRKTILLETLLLPSCRKLGLGFRVQGFGFEGLGFRASGRVSREIPNSENPEAVIHPISRRHFPKPLPLGRCPSRPVLSRAWIRESAQRTPVSRT